MFEALLLTLSAVQDPKSDVAIVDQFVSAGPAYPYEVREPVQAYLACLDAGERSFGFDESMEAVRVEDVARCYGVRIAEVIRATEIWTSKKAEQTARGEMEMLFASLSEHHLERGKIEDRQRSELLRQTEESKF